MVVDSCNIRTPIKYIHYNTHTSCIVIDWSSSYESERGREGVGEQKLKQQQQPQLDKQLQDKKEEQDLQKQQEL